MNSKTEKLNKSLEKLFNKNYNSRDKTKDFFQELQVIFFFLFYNNILFNLFIKVKLKNSKEEIEKLNEEMMEKENLLIDYKERNRQLTVLINENRYNLNSSIESENEKENTIFHKLELKNPKKLLKSSNYKIKEKRERLSFLQRIGIVINPEFFENLFENYCENTHQKFFDLEKIEEVKFNFLIKI